MRTPEQWIADLRVAGRSTLAELTPAEALELSEVVAIGWALASHWQARARELQAQVSDLSARLLSVAAERAREREVEAARSGEDQRACKTCFHKNIAPRLEPCRTCYATWAPDLTVRRRAYPNWKSEVEAAREVTGSTEKEPQR